MQVSQGRTRARRLGWPELELALESAMLDIQENGVSGDREARLRPYLIDAVRRGMRRTLAIAAERDPE